MAAGLYDFERRTVADLGFRKDLGFLADLGICEEGSGGSGVP